MPIPVTLNLKDKRVWYEPVIPQIDRGEEFELKVGEWDNSVKKLKLKNFRSFYFDHDQNMQKFVAGADTPDLEIEVRSTKQEPNYRIMNGGPHVFPFNENLENGKFKMDRHRLIEHDIELETFGGETITVDPAWDERP